MILENGPRIQRSQYKVPQDLLVQAGQVTVFNDTAYQVYVGQLITLLARDYLQRRKMIEKFIDHCLNFAASLKWHGNDMSRVINSFIWKL